MFRKLGNQRGIAETLAALAGLWAERGHAQQVVQELHQVDVRAGDIDVGRGDRRDLDARAVLIETRFGGRKPGLQHPPGDDVVVKERGVRIALRQQLGGQLHRLARRVGRPAEADARVGEARVGDALQANGRRRRAAYCRRCSPRSAAAA